MEIDRAKPPRPMGRIGRIALGVLAYGAIFLLAYLLSLPDSNVSTLWQSWLLATLLGVLLVAPLVVGWGRLIAERQRAQKDLSSREKTFRALSENTHDIIMRFDKDLQLSYANPQIELLGGSFKDKRGWHELHDLDLPATTVDLMESTVEKVFFSGEAHRLEFEVGESHALEWLMFPETDADGKVVGVIASGRDITERKKAEHERLRVAEILKKHGRLEAMAHLSGGVVHDFNNLLTGMIGCAELLMEDLEKETDEYELAKQIVETGGLAAERTSQLLLLSQRQLITPTLVNVVRFFENRLTRIERHFHEDTTVVFEGPDAPLEIKADTYQLVQLVNNIVDNAKDALHQAGRFTITVAQTHLDEAFCKLHPDARPGPYVLIKFADTGIGIDQTLLDKIFEPYVSYKSDTGKSGLGLAVVYGIVRQNGAQVTMESQVGEGTVVSIYWPEAS